MKKEILFSRDASGPFLTRDSAFVMSHLFYCVLIPVCNEFQEFFSDKEVVYWCMETKNTVNLSFPLRALRVRKVYVFRPPLCVLSVTPIPFHIFVKLMLRKKVLTPETLVEFDKVLEENAIPEYRYSTCPDEEPIACFKFGDKEYFISVLDLLDESCLSG